MYQNNRIFEEIFKNTCDCIVVIDEDGKVVLWNDACKNLLGYTFEEVLGKEVHRFLCSNEDYDRAKRAIESVKKSGKSPLSGKILNVTGYTKGGTKVKLVLSLSQIDLNGKTYFVGILRKTDYLMTLPTDSVISLDELLDVIPVPIFIKDRNLRYIHVNRAFEEFTGIKRIDAKGKTVFELYPYELAKVYNEQDLKILDRPEKQVYSFKMIKKDGVFREVEFHKASFLSKDGKVAGILGAYIDIQEKNELMRKLIYEKEKAEDALQAKSRFLSFMSHELRTPLSNIIGYTNLLLTSGGLTTVQEDSLRNIKNMAESLMAILTDLLELSKLEHQSLKLNPEEVNLPELIYEVVDQLKYECYLKGLEFYVHLSPTLPEIVVVDRLRLKQVLINLLSNAIKYTEKGYVELSIVCDKLYMPDDKIKLRFSVSDTGIGISQEQIDKIFSPFYRIEDKPSERKYGTGLGLYLSRRLVELMGSEIRVSSHLGKGSKFYFDLVFDVIENTSENYFDIYNGKRALLLLNLDRRFVSLMNHLIFWGLEVKIPSRESEIFEFLNKEEKFDFLIFDKDISWLNLDKVIEKIYQYKNSGKIENAIMIYKPIEDITQIYSKFSSITDVYLQKPVNPRRLMKIMERAGDKQVDQKLKTSIDVYKEHLKILIVDDLETNRKLLRYLIQRVAPNSEIFEADNGESAIIIHRSNSPNLIFMDIQMPRMDGYEALSILRQYDNETIVVALSAHSGSDEKEKALSAGFNYYIAKPITLNDLKKIFGEITSKALSERAEKINRIDYHYFTENQLDKEFVTNLLKLSLDTIPFYIEEIKNYYLKRDFERLKKAAHKLKGSSYSAGLSSLAKIAEFINKAERFDQETLQTKIDFLVKEWQETEKEIREFLNEVN